MEAISSKLLDEEIEKVRIQRQATWSRIKADAPDVAQFLTEINQAFGKPEAVRVVIQGEVVLDKGDLLPPRHNRGKL